MPSSGLHRYSMRVVCLVQTKDPYMEGREGRREGGRDGEREEEMKKGVSIRRPGIANINQRF